MVELYFQTLRLYANDTHLDMNFSVVINVTVKLLQMTSPNFLCVCKQYS